MYVRVHSYVWVCVHRYINGYLLEVSSSWWYRSATDSSTDIGNPFRSFTTSCTSIMTVNDGIPQGVDDMNSGDRVRVTADPQVGPHGLININEQDEHFPVAIVGIGLRVPGCDNLEEFDKVLTEGRCCILREATAGRWCWENYRCDSTQVPGKYCAGGFAFCDGYFDFDPAYFNISRHEANFIDPQNRQILEVTDMALQDAGILPDRLPRNTGVYMGLGMMDFPAIIVENRFFQRSLTYAGTQHSAASNRVSSYYGLTGPSVAVDTACAASLTAIHVACMSLWNRECECALAGATSVIYTCETTTGFSRLGVLSATGNSAPFDHTNNGYVRGEGTAVVVMKPLQDAIRDGDPVYCVMRATASAHNGYSMSLTLPSADAQESLIRSCYNRSGVPFNKVNFVEAHGTGTAVGDPLETEALGRTFGANRKEPLPVCSSKSNFGHLEVAAGMIQVIKAALMLKKRIFYRQLNWTAPNYRIDFPKLNLKIQMEMETYTGDESFKIGVNTFGFGGSLVHMLFEEYRPDSTQKPKYCAGWNFGDDEKEGRMIAIPLSARTPAALKDMAISYTKWNCDEDALIATSWIATRRRHHEERLVVVANSRANFREQLTAFIDARDDSGVIIGSVPTEKQLQPFVVFLFTGYGQQWIDMGRKLYSQEPIFKQSVDECDAIFQNTADFSALEAYNIFKERSQDASEFIDDACKPSIIFFQLAYCDLLRHWGVKPDAVIGVGLGDVSAAYASGALSRSDAIKSVYVRMSKPPMDEFITKMKSFINGPRPSGCEFYSTTTGELHNETLNAEYWWNNITVKPRFTDTIDALLTRHPDATLVEISALSNVHEQIQQAVEKHGNKIISFAYSNVDEHFAALQTLAVLHCAGVEVDWGAVTNNCARHVLTPVYPWQHEMFNLESNEYQERRLCSDDRSFRAQSGQVNIERHQYLYDCLLNGEVRFSASAAVEYLIEMDDRSLACIKHVKIQETPLMQEVETEGRYYSLMLHPERTEDVVRILNDDQVCVAYSTLGGVSGSDTDDNINSPSMDVTGIAKRCTNEISVDKLYNNLKNLGMECKIGFRMLESLKVGEVDAFGRIKASINKYERLHTVVLESAFQAAAAAFTSGKSLFMVKSIGHIRMHVPRIPDHIPLTVHVIRRLANVEKIVCDIFIGTENGVIMAALREVTFENSVLNKTDVDLAKCLYTTEWQPIKGCLPSPQKYSMVKDECACSKDAVDGFEHCVAQQCRALLNDADDVGEETLPLREILRNAAAEIQSEDGKLFCVQDDTSFTEEINCLSALATIFKSSTDVALTEHRDNIINYLRNSVAATYHYQRAISATKWATIEALRTKKVVSICQIGETTGSLATRLVNSLSDYIHAGRVNFTFADFAGETIADVQQQLCDWSVIKYEILDNSCETNATQSKYDIVVYHDNENATLEALTCLGERIVEEGWLVTLANTRTSKFIDIISADRERNPVNDVNKWCMNLQGAGFDNIRATEAQSAMHYSLLIGQKGAAKPTIEKETFAVIATAGKEDIVSALQQKWVVSNGILNIKHSTKGANDIMNFIYVADRDITSHLMSNMEVLLSREDKKSARLWIVTCGASIECDDVEQASVVGYARAIANTTDLPIFTLDISCNTPTLMANDIITGVLGSVSNERENAVRNSLVMVPRVVRLGLDCNAISNVFQLKSTRNSVFTSYVMPPIGRNQIQVRVRATKSGSSSDLPSAYCGFVEAIGDDVTSVAINQWVMGIADVASSHVITNAENVMPKPVNVDYRDVVASLFNYTLAYKVLVSDAKLRYGETLLLPAALDAGLLRASVAIAKLQQAKVIISGKSLHVSDMDCLHLVSSPFSNRFRAEVMQYTEGRGCDIAILGSELSVECMSYGARLCSLGADSGSFLSGDVNVDVIASTTFEKTHVLWQRSALHVAGLILDGTLKIAREGLVTSAAELQRNSTEISPAEVIDFSDKFCVSPAVGDQLSLNEEGTYMITGATGRIGQEIVRWLCNAGAKYIGVLLRPASIKKWRSSLAQQYAINCGCMVHEFIADVSSASDLQQVFEEYPDTLPQVKGIFHAAGWTDNLADNTGEGFSQMRNTQVNGAIFLHKESLTHNLRLDYFVMFSSAVTLWGASKLASLCAASSALDALATRRRASGLPALSAQLGLVRGTGVVSESPEITSAMEADGMMSLHISEYLQVIGSLLQRKHTSPVVSITNQNWVATYAHCYQGCARFAHLIEAESEEVEAGASPEELLRRRVVNLLATLLGCQQEAINPDLPFMQHGVDSIMSTDIIAWAKENFDVTIEQSEIFAGMTLTSMLRKLTDQ